MRFKKERERRRDECCYKFLNCEGEGERERNGLMDTTPSFIPLLT